MVKSAEGKYDDGEHTPTVVDKPLRGAYFTAPIERVIKNPHSAPEHNALMPHKSAESLAVIIAVDCAWAISARGEKYTKMDANKTPSMLPRKQTGNFHRFFAPISGMYEINPVNNFMSNITMHKMPRENQTAPINFANSFSSMFILQANKNAVPPMPIMTPEQNAIKQKEINCAFVNFSKGFI